MNVSKALERACAVHNEDCVRGMRERVDELTVDLVLADPPYFKTVGEKWDYRWRTEKEYVEWSEQWLGETVRTLRLGGSFYLFGYFRMLCRLLPVLESLGMELRQQIVVDKGLRTVAGRATRSYKMFPTVTESILFLYKDPKPFVRKFLKERQRTLGLDAREINERLGVKSNGGGMWSIFTGANVCAQMPTEDIWNRLERILDFCCPYRGIAQTWHVQPGLGDVWRDIDFYGDKPRLYPTQKPLKLMERLIVASSDPGDFVLDPFAGSDTAAVACCRLGRRYVGFETDTAYYDKCMERLRRTG